MTGFVGRSHPYIHMDEVAKLLNARLDGGEDKWSPRRVQRWLLHEKAVLKVGRFWVTSASRLRDAFPEFWQDMMLNANSTDD